MITVKNTEAGTFIILKAENYSLNLAQRPSITANNLSFVARFLPENKNISIKHRTNIIQLSTFDLLSKLNGKLVSRMNLETHFFPGTLTRINGCLYFVVKS